MLPLLKLCCCGCSLQSGAILIGAYQLVIGLFELILDSILVDSVWIPDAPSAWEELWTILPCIFVALAVIKVAVAFVLLIGANKERYKLVFWWLIVTVSLTIIDTAVLPLNAVALLHDGTTIPAIFVVFTEIVDIVLKVYFLWVVYSYYRIIEERAPAPPRHTA